MDLFFDYAGKYGEEGTEKREALILDLCITEPDNIKLLSTPGSNSFAFELAAKLIVKLGYSTTKPYINDICKFLQDTNWYGADIIMQFLLSFPKDVLIFHLKSVLRIAFNQKDDCWVWGICSVIDAAGLMDVFINDEEFF